MALHFTVSSFLVAFSGGVATVALDVANARLKHWGWLVAKSVVIIGTVLLCYAATVQEGVSPMIMAAFTVPVVLGGFFLDRRRRRQQAAERDADSGPSRPPARPGTVR